MQNSNYVHADHVLPKHLIEQIQQYTSGLLYVPTVLAQVRQVTAFRIKSLKEQGMRNCEIAIILGITPRQVCGILQRSEAASGKEMEVINSPEIIQKNDGVNAVSSMNE